jgi:hypothetical protein
VTTKSRTMLAMTVGAAFGALAGYMFFTEQGRTFRRQLDTVLDDVARELSHFRGTLQKAADVASESWKLLNDPPGDAGPQPTRYADPRQTSPF